MNKIEHMVLQLNDAYSKLNKKYNRPENETLGKICSFKPSVEEIESLDCTLSNNCTGQFRDALIFNIARITMAHGFNLVTFL